MDEQQFLKLTQSKGYSPQNQELFHKAIALAKSVLGEKKRLSGDTVYEHNLRLAAILLESKSEPEVILAGILQETLQHIDKKIIEATFGKEVIPLLEGSEELKAIKLKHLNLDPQALRKIFLTALKDVRVILIKLAGKIDNLQTITPLPISEQKRIAGEVLEIYAPLAYRLGAEKIRVQLEDEAFKIINPRKYQEIRNFLEDSREEQEKDIQNAITKIKNVCAPSIPLLNIKGRPKHVYSIYKKIIGKGTKLNEQYDLLGIRIIVPEEKDCYALLGILHEKFEPIEGRLKDYIAHPKTNLYQSLHTGLKLENGKILEVQIRTPQMDEFAQEGLAAHWRYKGLKSEQNFEKKVAWLKSILELQKDEKEFLETVKVDLFGDKIYCYTPKGDVKELPLGALLLDFAYAIHEEIGNHAVAGRVNGVFVPLKRELAKGDVIEIVTSKNQRPRRTWLKMVVSTKSRQKIRKALKEFENLPALHYRQLKPEIAQDQGILVECETFPNAQCSLAKCCSPLPAQSIIGILTKRRLVSVHKEDCKIAIKEQERWSPVTWRQTFNQKIRFYITAKERSGLLADLLHTIAKAGFEIKEAKAKMVDTDKAECCFQVIPRDLQELQDLIVRIRKLQGILRIQFE